jgi:hypothetical protein
VVGALGTAAAGAYLYKKVVALAPLEAQLKEAQEFIEQGGKPNEEIEQAKKNVESTQAEITRVTTDLDQERALLEGLDKQYADMPDGLVRFATDLKQKMAEFSDLTKRHGALILEMNQISYQSEELQRILARIHEHDTLLVKTQQLEAEIRLLTELTPEKMQLLRDAANAFGDPARAQTELQELTAKQEEFRSKEASFVTLNSRIKSAEDTLIQIIASNNNIDPRAISVVDTGPNEKMEVFANFADDHLPTKIGTLSISEGTFDPDDNYFKNNFEEPKRATLLAQIQELNTQLKELHRSRLAEANNLAEFEQNFAAERAANIEISARQTKLAEYITLSNTYNTLIAAPQGTQSPDEARLKTIQEKNGQLEAHRVEINRIKLALANEERVRALVEQILAKNTGISPEQALDRVVHNISEATTHKSAEILAEQEGSAQQIAAMTRSKELGDAEVRGKIAELEKLRALDPKIVEAKKAQIAALETDIAQKKTAAEGLQKNIESKTREFDAKFSAPQLAAAAELARKTGEEIKGFDTGLRTGKFAFSGSMMVMLAGAVTTALSQTALKLTDSSQAPLSPAASTMLVFDALQVEVLTSLAKREEAKYEIFKILNSTHY